MSANVFPLHPEQAGTVLLAGAAGFIGSHLADRLLDDGHRVIGIDNLITGRLQNIAHLRDHPRFRFLRGDITQPLDVDEPLDWVMHFASPASPPKYQQYPMETLQANSIGTHRLLELADSHQARFFYASTSEVYGDPIEHPQQESHWGNCNPNGPRSMYDEAKRYAEAATMAYHRATRLPVRIVRIFNTYGPRMDPWDGRIVTNFVRQALANEPLTIFGDGSQTRSLQYIDDLIEGIARYMKVDYAGPVNLGNPGEYSVSEIACMVRRLARSRSALKHHPLPADDPRRRRPDIALAQRLLRWTPRVGAEEGLARTIAASIRCGEGAATAKALITGIVARSAVAGRAAPPLRSVRRTDR
ncbi:MAG TPA: UDP-glucuronic acid decarboxylase family protein [Rhodanobacteraceae bacterium]|nr:UDP-glucuronic acid decarboxylase family protein [Rhodanobacteraceae bacterium]